MVSDLDIYRFDLRGFVKIGFPCAGNPAATLGCCSLAHFPVTTLAVKRDSRGGANQDINILAYFCLS